MKKWRIDRTNKMPFYLQLKELIIYYISTGVIQDNHQLPGVNILGKQLGINFETVRKAYKELEKDGLIKMERGRGTYVTLQNGPIPKKNDYIRSTFNHEELIRTGVKGLLHKGMNTEDVRKMILNILEETRKERFTADIFFTECNLYQVREYSKILSAYLGHEVKPVLLKDIKEEVERNLKSSYEKPTIITTGFHINEIRNAFKDQPVRVLALIMSMSPETRLALQGLGKDACFGFICRDSESLSFWEELLKEELGTASKISCCILDDKEELIKILNNADVLLASPPVYEGVKKIAPEGTPVFNIFDRVDKMSLQLLKDRLLEVT